MDSSELRMNLAALQRIDPYIKTIKESSSAVALYRYVEDEWCKTNTEGTLFVYERKCQPTNGFLILNRLNPDNWVQPITEGIDSQIKPPFILFKTRDSEIFGIWFYEEEKCKHIGHTINKLIKELESERNKSSSSSAAAPNPSAPAAVTPGGGKMDLSSLLSKASTQSAASPSTNDASNKSKEINLRTTKDSPSSGGEKLLRLLSQASAPPPLPPSMTSAADEKENVGPPPPSLMPQAREVRNNGDAPAAAVVSTSSVVEFFAQASHLPEGVHPAPPPVAAAVAAPPAAVAGPPPGGPHIVGPAVVGPVPGVIPIMHGVPPGMALLPQQPGAPPVLVPIIRPGPNQPVAGAGGLLPGAIQPMLAGPPVAVTSAAPMHQAPQQGPPNAMHSLLSNPGAVSLEALERTQREESVTPPAAVSSGGGKHQHQPKVSSGGHDMENDLKNKLNIGGGGMAKQQQSPAAASKGKSPRGHNAARSPAASSGLTPGNKKSSSYASAVGFQPPVAAATASNAAAAAAAVNQKQQKRQKQQQQQQQLSHHQQLSSAAAAHKAMMVEDEPELLSPMVFSQPAAAEQLNGGSGNGPVMMTSSFPADDLAPMTSMQLDENPEITPLTQNQLVQAMQHLLRTDKTFVGKLHQAYVESLNNKLH